MRWIMLQNTDYLWVQHLTAIEDVRQGIGLRAYGQQDPAGGPSSARAIRCSSS